jgi:hypothetical protein
MDQLLAEDILVQVHTGSHEVRVKDSHDGRCARFLFFLGHKFSSWIQEWASLFIRLHCNAHSANHF